MPALQTKYSGAPLGSQKRTCAVLTMRLTLWAQSNIHLSYLFAPLRVENKCSIESVVSENWQSVLFLKSFSLDLSLNRRCRGRSAKALKWAV